MKIMLIETFCLFDKSDKYFLLIQSQLHHEMITEMNHSMWGMMKNTLDLLYVIHYLSAHND